MYNSFETERLQKLIQDKRSQFVKLYNIDKNSPALSKLNDEITLLSDTILPLLLMKTTLFYNELNHFVTKTFRKLEAAGENIVEKTNGVLIYYEFKPPKSKDDTPIIAFDSNKYLFDTGRAFYQQIYGLKTRTIIMQDFKGWTQTKLSEPLKFVDPRTLKKQSDER